MSSTNHSINQQDKKHASIAYLLWGLGFMGICGMHRMYLGQYGLGAAMLFTFGLCGVGQLVDVAVIPKATRETNAKNGYAIKPDSSKDVLPTSDQASTTPVVAGSSKATERDEWDLEQASIEETMKKLRE